MFSECTFSAVYSLSTERTLWLALKKRVHSECEWTESMSPEHMVLAARHSVIHRITGGVGGKRDKFKEQKDTKSPRTEALGASS